MIDNKQKYLVVLRFSLPVFMTGEQILKGLNRSMPKRTEFTINGSIYVYHQKCFRGKITPVYGDDKDQLFKQGLFWQTQPLDWQKAN